MNGLQLTRHPYGLKQLKSVFLHAIGFHNIPDILCLARSSFGTLLNRLIYHMRNAVVTWKYYSVDSETLKGWQCALISSEDSHDDHEAT